ncbi:MAG TPA: antitoxin VapB family protein [Candidatus Thermoplasmatota archaeon]|nr:antitoxin VapB family protein [Candidatus Thermoplasmatota archaeon]
MASKTISLEEGAYAILLQAKRGDESFSEVVQRLLRPQEDPMRRLSGLVSPAKGKAMRDLLDKQRALEREAATDRYRRLGLL